MRFLFIIGGGLMMTSLFGKTFIYVYRWVKQPSNIKKANNMFLGKSYYGGFLSKMTKMEASLILGVVDSNDKE